MAAVNSVSSSRLPLPTFSPRAVLMYSAAVGGEGSVALQLREATAAELRDDRLQLTCSQPQLLAGLLHAADIGPESDSLSVLLGSSSPDLTLTSDTSDSLPLSDIDNDPPTTCLPARVTTMRVALSGLEPRAPIAGKKVRPKPASPNRQGPQQCQVCNKVFGNASALAKHKLTHSDERKYVCTVCSKAFKRQDHLNGHMLTHRNKKPFECKADGCGKSYCDARSLRRHTENHHHDSSKRRMSESASTVVHDVDPPAQSSPRAATPAPPPANSSHVDSMLDNLCASTAAAPAAAATATPAPAAPASPLPRSLSPFTTTARNRPTIKNVKAKPFVGSPLQQGSKNNEVGSTGSPGAVAPAVPKPLPESKPVECNLCHRKFKNIPALNGHMRLHGGYFKKDSDAKKLDKKETTGPPLQTASVSVRALIEEKIISRRTATSTNTTTSASEASSSKSGFAAPAPPSLSTTRSTVTATSATATSTTSQFVSPRPPMMATTSTSSVSTPRDSALIELLKKGNGTKVVKRSASDPGQASPQHEFTFRPELFGVSFNSDDGYFSPALNDDAFHFSTTPEQMDEFASLEDYATVAASLRDRSPVTFPSSIKLAAVLNSPLPESLADFGACHGGSPVHSPGIGYADNSSGLSYATGDSPGLPYTAASPGAYSAHQPSPGIAYPTPPASHDAQSPAQTAPRASSPLTAAFFTATMSSQEEVEEALEEVLPEECGSLDAYALEPSPAPRRIMLNSEDPLLSSSPRDFASQRPFRRLQRVASTSQMHWPPEQAGTSSLQVCVEGRETGTVLPSPSGIPYPRRKRRANPATAGPYRSRRRPLTDHYTPPPMLPPDRDAPGLLVDVDGSSSDAESEATFQSLPPRINVGPAHQALLPELRADRADLSRPTEQLLWDPGINDSLHDAEVRMFMELAMCAAMPVGGHSRESALQTLGECGGDVRAATLKLMSRPADPAPYPQRWTPEEVDAFLTGLQHYHKDFYKIAQLIRTKDSKQCIQFYYFWKKVQRDYKAIFTEEWNMDVQAPTPSTSRAGAAPAAGPASCSASPAPFEGEEFPCKICGKVFNKVKSRSAHMKSHRPLDAEPKRPKFEKPFEKVDDRTHMPPDGQNKH